jgi:hypothetical protein
MGRNQYLVVAGGALPGPFGGSEKGVRGGPDGKKNISRVGEIFVGADDCAVETTAAGLLAETKIAWFAHFVDKIRGV